MPIAKEPDRDADGYISARERRKYERAMDKITHNWQPIPDKPGWIEIPGKRPCLVKLVCLPQGYIWQYGQQYGFAPSADLAKEWAEAAREFYPRKL